MNYVGNPPAPAGVILVGDTNPIGSIGWFHAPPDGSWLQLNGQAVLKATYADLWAYAQGFLTADQVANPGLYKSIDANTFAVPKLDGLFLRGLGGAAAALGVKQDFAAVGAAYSNVAFVPCVKALRTVLMPATVLPNPSTRLIAEKVAANSPTLDFTNLTGYFGYRFILQEIAPAADNITFGFVLSTDNGASWITGVAYAHVGSGVDVSGAVVTVSSAGNNMISLATGLSNIGGRGYTGEVLSGDLSGGHPAHFVHQGGWLKSGAATFIHANGFGEYNTAAAINGVRFYSLSGGNLTSGRIRCYGISA